TVSLVKSTDFARGFAEPFSDTCLVLRFRNNARVFGTISHAKTTGSTSPNWRGNCGAQHLANQDLREGTCDETSFGGCVDSLFCRFWFSNWKYRSKLIKISRKTLENAPRTLAKCRFWETTTIATHENEERLIIQ